MNNTLLSRTRDAVYYMPRFLVSTLFSFLFCYTALADDNLDDIEDKIKSGGEELAETVLGVSVILMMLALMLCGAMWMAGNAEKAKKWAANIAMGGGIIIFASGFAKAYYAIFG